ARRHGRRTRSAPRGARHHAEHGARRARAGGPDAGRDGGMRRGPGAAYRAPVIVGAVLALVAGWVAARDVEADLGTERDLHAVPYAGAAECRRCHEAHFESWHRTYHRTMTQEASDAAVLGDFDGAELEYMGVIARMHRD